jgi:hypothetical protein
MWLASIDDEVERVERRKIMGMFRRTAPSHYISIHPDNIAKNDWIILLEAGTIVGPSAEKIRVAKATLERKIVAKYHYCPNIK